MKDITDTVNDVCMVRQCMGYNYICVVGYCLYGALLLRPRYCMSRTNQSSSSHRCLHRHQQVQFGAKMPIRHRTLTCSCKYNSLVPNFRPRRNVRRRLCLSTHHFSTGNLYRTRSTIDLMSVINL